jgi:ATP-dependent RNA helicase RhlE
MKFSDYRFAPEIKENLESLGLIRPTDIQYKSITPILAGEDLLAIAQTGTGKTAAFVIPVVNSIFSHKLRTTRKDGIQAIVMVPTRELAIQITKVFNDIEANTSVRTICVHGGVEQDAQISKLNRGADILVATPGRMFDLVSQGHIDLHRIRTLILDEADRMLDLGFYKDIQDLIKHLPKRRQTLFFSATIDQNIKKLSYSLINSAAIRIQISPKDPVSKNVTHFVTMVEMDDKRFFLERLVNQHKESKIIVFVRTKVRAERVCKAMERVGISTATLHGGKEQVDRLKVLESFKNDDIKILIATDISARGIDINGIEFVVNYDIPDIADNYVHRIGRTGRGRSKGTAISFCAEEEQTMLKEIEKYIGGPIDRITFSKNDYSETIDFSQESAKSIMNLIEENENFISDLKKKKAQDKNKAKEKSKIKIKNKMKERAKMKPGEKAKAKNKGKRKK